MKQNIEYDNKSILKDNALQFSNIVPIIPNTKSIVKILWEKRTGLFATTRLIERKAKALFYFPVFWLLAR